MFAAHAVVDDHGDRLVGCIVHDDQALERVPRGDPVEHEVRGSHVVGRSRTDRRLTLPDGNLLASPPAHLQLLQTVQPLDALVID
jgi:hypothetical protein